MFQEPKNYTDSDHFFFQADNDLEEVCNAPKNKEGVFKVLELRKGKLIWFISVTQTQTDYLTK